VSTLNVDKVDPSTGTALEIGSSGDTITVPSGATFNVAGTLQEGGSALVTGKIGQVLSTTKTDTFSVNSRSYSAITGLSVAITPSATSSKILVIVSLQGVSSNRGYAVILRDSTEIGVGATAGDRTSGSFGEFYSGDGTRLDSTSASVLDSPSSVSAITYSVSCLTTTSSVFYVNRSTTDTDSATYSRSASTITVMEVLA
tara:strand:+ start:23 stop:622 length:600 start_codon:yes stop_codon:yes gene_type:complete